MQTQTSEIEGFVILIGPRKEGMVFHAGGYMGGVPSKQAQTGGELENRAGPHGKCFTRGQGGLTSKSLRGFHWSV